MLRSRPASSEIANQTPPCPVNIYVDCLAVNGDFVGDRGASTQNIETGCEMTKIDHGEGEIPGPGQIQRLIDRYEIDQLLANWLHGLDGKDAALWLSAFHTDGVFEVDAPAAYAKGHDAILEWASTHPWSFQTRSHITCAHRIDFIDDHSATGLGRGAGVFKIEDGTVLLTTGRLDDRYQKRNGVWKIAHRKVSVLSGFKLDGAVDSVLNGVLID